jgi:two-component system sensor histidine kinase HydH
MNQSRTASTEQYLELAELAGCFIHEIKNHINTLSLNLQLLGEEFEHPESPRERKAAERIQRLTEECRRLVDLSNDFLRYARLTELNPEMTSLEPLITRLVDFLAPTARAQGITINWYIDPDLPRILLDIELFEKVLLNLMLNAEEAMPHGGTLTLQARVEAQEVQLEIIDTGCGIPPEIRDQIFRPFVTTKADGHGLGLATARKIVLAHGGSIEVQSEPQRGTKFTIRLPIPEEQSP